MKTTLRRAISIALAAGATVPVAALATNGYFAAGWGTQSKAMAGVATALPQDTLVTATNPAGMAFIGNTMDIAVEAFRPSPRGYTANADFSTQQVPAVDAATGAKFNATFPTGAFVTPGTYDSGSDWFAIPSFGYNYVIDDRQTIGVALFGNGGMNTHYSNAVWANFAPAPNQRVTADGQLVFATNPPLPPPAGRVIIQNGRPIPVTAPVPGTVNGNPNGVFTAYGPTGVSLEQLFIEVPYTYKFGDGKQAVSIAPVLAIQSFEARGLQPFRALSVHPDYVTNNGKDWSYGGGLHFGWYGQVTDQLALGMSYRTQIWMTPLSEYKGLFADGGKFDIPAMFNLGAAYKVQPNVTLAFDYQHIFYDTVAAISNPNNLDPQACRASNYCLGQKSGLGFGWNSMDVFKLGARWDVNDRWKLFGGFSYATDLLKSNTQALFDVLAPATIKWTITTGATYVYTPKDQFSLAIEYSPKSEIDGTSPSITQSQTGSIYMTQLDIQVGWQHHF